MQPFYTAVTNLVHGLFTMMVLLVLVDVASPSFNVSMTFTLSRARGNRLLSSAIAPPCCATPIGIIAWGAHQVA